MSDGVRVLGIDPGLARVGWGVVETRGPRFVLHGYGTIATPSRELHPQRLLAIFRGLQEVIDRERPDRVAVEEVVLGRGPRSSIHTGEARGACVLAAADRGLEVREFPATVVKVSLTGNGRASKVQVQKMVARLLSLEELPRPQDAADALAVALTDLNRSRGSHSLRARS